MLYDSGLFRDIDEEKLKDFLVEHNAYVRRYRDNSYVFRMGDEPKELYLLLDGKVQIEQVSSLGKRRIINQFTKRGTIFGEVYVYLNKRPFDYDCITKDDAEVLHIPREILDFQYGPIAGQINRNMLTILSEKALFLNQKLMIQSGETLRHKIALFLLYKDKGHSKVKLALKREELADFLGVARPSLSRELSKMQSDNLIEVDGNVISFDRRVLEELTF